MSINVTVSSPPMIQVAGLDKTYTTQSGEEVAALRGIHLSVVDGEFVSVVGPSGCGKSTLMKIVAGLIPRSSGHVFVRGSAVDGPRRDIGVVFQNPVLLPWRNVLQNILLPVQVLGLDERSYVGRARSLIAMAGLGSFEDKYPFELSGGMQQRCSIIRSLIHDPSILLMDEPFGALDAMLRERMNVKLQEIWLESRKTVLFITHSIAEAVFLADRVVVMSPRPGEIVDILTVDLPRPRSMDLMASAEFGEYTRAVRRHFESRGGLD